jgi:hypothetical protein
MGVIEKIIASIFSGKALDDIQNDDLTNILNQFYIYYLALLADSTGNISVKSIKQFMYYVYNNFCKKTGSTLTAWSFDRLERSPGSILFCKIGALLPDIPLRTGLLALLPNAVLLTPNSSVSKLPRLLVSFCEILTIGSEKTALSDLGVVPETVISSNSVKDASATCAWQIETLKKTNPY